MSRLIATLAIAAVVATGTILGGASDAAWAASYPSWSEVQKARTNEAAKKTQIAALIALLKQLEANVSTAQAESEKKGQQYYEAQLAYDAAAYKSEQFQLQADEAQLAADESIRKAGQLVARAQRAGGNDLSAQLFFGEDGATDLLSNLGMASKVSEQSNGIYTKAKQDQNTAQALTNQANLAKDALKGLAEAAEKAMVEAQKAADAATAALQEQDGNQARLEAQLASLVENREVTEAQYATGVEVARVAEVERKRKAAIAAAAAAAAAAAGGGNAGNSNGWTRPVSGFGSTSSYGPRVPPFPGASSWHMGEDFQAGCYQNIYAASSGRVVYAGWNGGYGNFIKIDHGNGLTTGYAHIVGGGIKVRYGQQVGVGQVIAQVGNTGASSGCHLHFEVRNYNTATNPITFLRGMGVNT